MKRTFLPIVLAVVALVELALLLLSLREQGFPDGHLTALDRVHRTTFPLFAGLFALFAMSAMVLHRKSTTSSPRTGVWLLVFLALHGACFCTEAYSRSHYENGTGG